MHVCAVEKGISLKLDGAEAFRPPSNPILRGCDRFWSIWSAMPSSLPTRGASTFRRLGPRIRAMPVRRGRYWNRYDAGTSRQPVSSVFAGGHFHHASFRRNRTRTDHLQAPWLAWYLLGGDVILARSVPHVGSTFRLSIAANGAVVRRRPLQGRWRRKSDRGDLPAADRPDFPVGLVFCWQKMGGTISD